MTYALAPRKTNSRDPHQLLQFLLKDVRLSTNPFSQVVYSPPAQLDPGVCENPLPFPTTAPVSIPLTMALEAETKKIVAQFEYSDEDANKGVLEFLRQMGKL